MTGPRNRLTSEADLLAYSYDGALDRHRPDAVVLADDSDEVGRTVSRCLQEKMPVVARGAGTNLSGGCVPSRGGVVLSLARMNKILSIDSHAREACVEPGVVNLKLQERLAPQGLFYAPDPASYRVCTLGGNIAENAGGPRCLKYGVTANHVRALEAVMPDGEIARFSLQDEGPDLMGLLVGAEGTLGVVTKIWLGLLPEQKSIRTLLAGFPSVQAAIECVSDIIAAGIIPRVLEALDRATVESVEDYNHAGYPKTEAVLLIELDGNDERAAGDAGEVDRICRKHGCEKVIQASDPAQRDRLWEGRRAAYAAVARIAPNVLVEDGVVPRGLLPEAYRRIRSIAETRRVRVAMLFHAGDGNLHPNIAFDERDPSETRRVKEAGFEMLRACVELGGSISGEHGIGTDKRAAMGWLFSRETLDLFRRIKHAFDPQNLFNPDKILPLAGETPPDRVLLRPVAPLSRTAKEIVDKMRANSSELHILGAGTKLPKAISSKFRDETVLRMDQITEILEFDRSNYTVRAEAGITAQKLKSQLGAGFHAPMPDFPGTLGGLIATKAWAALRDHVLGMRLLLANGDVVDLGGKVMKNVAGYDAAKLLFGSWGSLAVILDVTLKLYPFSIEMPRAMPALKPFEPNVWHRKVKEAFDQENRLNPWCFHKEAIIK